ncbi:MULTISPECIES: amino acid aminotransferase [unclassified Janthinobacterium]|uniref:amino acid aminotransferase n=1 Tax=unclassified Janthinobacterium TaxID=2610881 RepID=UPI00034B9020|nr:MULTISPECIES: amino acid aminotransferase [unclassified Janthinobacterium]MEC5161918.1 aromatic-amino-acid transaminase [Janthinobacterium sp. CG_S6]
MFEHVDIYPGDPILTLNETFIADPRAGKINLGIGVYLNEASKLPVMGAVLKAETALLANPGIRPYLPMEGAPSYRKQVQRLLFGADAPALAEQRVATAQTVGGSGALKVGADFLAAYFKQAEVWICDPTWDNHRAIFAGAGFTVHSYPYYSAAIQHVDFTAMQAALNAVPAGDIVVLHACCHNPTGADLSEAQWRELAKTISSRKLLPFFDIAYQGFGGGIDADAFAIRHFVAEGIPLLVASSFSKNFSLYGERCGSLSIVCDDAQEAANVLGQLKAAIRRNYSSPPTHGARIVATVLENPELAADWSGELEAMRGRIQAMREGLYAQLRALRPERDFEYLIKQSGMFSYTGLTVAQVRKLREESAIYLLESGRVCIAALTRETLAPVAAAIAKVLD